MVLGLVIVLAAFGWVLTRGDSAPTLSEPEVTTPAPTPELEPCDDAATDAGACPTPEVIASDTLEGAIERMVKGTPRDADARFLLLNQQDWDVLFIDTLGPAVLTPGAEFELSGVLGSAIGSSTPRLAFQEEWRAQSGGILVQQLLLLDDPAAADAALTRFRSASREAGLAELKDAKLEKEFRSGLGDEAFITSFVDPSATGFFADRRCAVQAAVSAGPLLLVLTFFEGSGCTTAKAYPAVVGATALRSRVLEVLANREF